MEKVISGIRPTGNLHLGNYFGAVKSFVKMQEEYNCMFFIADWHSLTTHPTPENLRTSVKTILAEYLACGIDPQKASIYIQSDVKQILELYLYLNMNAYLGELERVTSFKEKARKQPDNVNAGLLTYPSLMAADILVHKADKVPVGKDQEQNMEMARKFASRTHFVHLRSCHIFENGDFTEASHLGGRANLIELVRIFEKQKPELPMRVDHGMTMLGDESRGYNAGYAFLGRMFAMGQVQGIMAVVDNELGLKYKITGFYE